MQGKANNRIVPYISQPMIYHPLLALSKIKGLTEVVIIGFYEDSLFADFLKQAKREFPGMSIS